MNGDENEPRTTCSTGTGTGEAEAEAVGVVAESTKEDVGSDEVVQVLGLLQQLGVVSDEEEEERDKEEGNQNQCDPIPGKDTSNPNRHVPDERALVKKQGQGLRTHARPTYAVFADEQVKQEVAALRARAEAPAGQPVSTISARVTADEQVKQEAAALRARAARATLGLPLVATGTATTTNAAITTTTAATATSNGEPDLVKPLAPSYHRYLDEEQTTNAVENTTAYRRHLDLGGTANANDATVPAGNQGQATFLPPTVPRPMPRPRPQVNPGAVSVPGIDAFPFGAISTPSSDPNELVGAVDTGHQVDTSAGVDADADTAREDNLNPLHQGNGDEEQPRQADLDWVLSARLVPESEPFRSGNMNHEAALVEAKPLMESFQELLHNRKFRIVMAATLVVILAIIIPLSVFLPGGDSVVTENVTQTFIECGTVESRQDSYEGTIAVDRYGNECKNWSDFTEFEDYGLSHNYCRNPTQSKSQAWCFTNGSKLWEFCDVPYCSDDEITLNTMEDKTLDCGTLLTMGQKDYRGTVNTTEDGYTCQRWDSQYPNRHTRTKENYPTAGLDENYCRNPDGEARAWCYTNSTEKRWSFCNVPICELQDKVVLANYQIDASVVRSELPVCVNCSKDECGSNQIQFTDYRGNINVTRSGIPCQRWDSHDVHEHRGIVAEKYPESDLVENYCRNPDGEPFAWCYTMDPTKRYDYCNVPICADYDYRKCGRYHSKQIDYRGTMNVTKSGIPCQKWAETYPHVHFTVPWLYVDANLTENHCRNPEPSLGYERAWCYTQNKDVIWEYCDVPYCEPERMREQQRKCAAMPGQIDYRGTLSTTVSGRMCMKWTGDFPHKTQFNQYPSDEYQLGQAPAMYDVEDFVDHNYCRNYGSLRTDPQQWSRAYCYTTDPTVVVEECAVEWCFPNSTMCGTKKEKQADYIGTMNLTESGAACGPWRADNATEALNSTLMKQVWNHNYCRNPMPESRERAWCLLSSEAGGGNQTLWEYCDIPMCYY